MAPGFKLEGMVVEAKLSKEARVKGFDGRLVLKISSDKEPRQVNLPFNYGGDNSARLVEQALQGQRVEYSYDGTMADMCSDHVEHKLSVKSGVLIGKEYSSSEFIRV
ncbi:MAG: hypothetical protein AABX10_00345 [Nanoarchaeota archaeon]